MWLFMAQHGAARRDLGGIWGFPKSRGALLGVPKIRTTIFCGLDRGPPILGNCHMKITTELWSPRKKVRGRHSEKHP